MRLPQLKIKLKSLAAESKIIRKDELKYLFRAGDLKWFHAQYPEQYPSYPTFRDEFLATAADLSHHRRQDVRLAARHSYLAYGFLRGLPYYKIENKRYTEPDWKKVADIVFRFGGGSISAADVYQNVCDWYKMPPLNHNESTNTEKVLNVPSN